MRKFKLFFYPIYLIVAFLVLYFSIDILANMDAYKERVDFTMLRKLPEYMLYLLLIVSLLMITELVSENFHLIRLRRKARQSEKQVLELKARLYDKAQNKPAPPVAEDEEPENDTENESEGPADDEEKEDEDDYKLS